MPHVVSAATAGSAALQLLDRQNSNAAAGPSKSSSRPLGRQRNSINYSLLAGNRKPDAKVPGSLHKGGKKSSHKSSPVPQSEVRKDQAALAVAAAIAEGKLSPENCLHLLRLYMIVSLWIVRKEPDTRSSALLIAAAPRLVLNGS